MTVLCTPTKAAARGALAAVARRGVQSGGGQGLVRAAAVTGRGEGRSFHATPSSLKVSVDNLSPLYQFGGVHGNTKLSGKTWRNKPLFRRQGDQQFKTGAEAADMLVAEARRKDPHKSVFLESIADTIPSLAPVFDRQPKTAWIAKQLIEPERAIQFRVAWLDDHGNSRMNRGFRVQYSSALGPYEGSLHFSGNVNMSLMKAQGLDTVFSNALSGCSLGAAVGGADFNPHDKSEAEIQRFCQSFMTELSKYIGPDLDSPAFGFGCGPSEIGYLYGQYKRINEHIAQRGKGVLWGGTHLYPQAIGSGVVHFADAMLRDKNEGLKGKRCLVTGSGKVALAVAEKLLEYGAIPLTFTDQSGHIYESAGIDQSKMKTILKIKAERGARLGRYIIASTTAQYNDPENIFNIPCDLVFACAQRDEIDAATATSLADNGCMGVIEGGNQPCSKEAKAVFRKRGIMFAPHKATGAAAGLVSGPETSVDLTMTADMLEARIKDRMQAIFDEVKQTAKEYNTRGDLQAGADIAGFRRVAEVMLTHGAV